MDTEGPIETEETPPPNILQVKKRLMVCWANTGRSFLEDEYRETPEEAPDDVNRLRDWVLGPLADAATQHELERHALPLAQIPQQDVRDDSWDTQAAMPLLWALGVLDSLPPWHQGRGFDSLVDDFYDFPDPETWRPELTLRDEETIDREGMIYETIMWRIRCADGTPEPNAYTLKLMLLAHKLGHVRLAEDGDLAASYGRPFRTLSRKEIQDAGSIVSERLESLNWLTGHDTNWDMVTADSTVHWLWDHEWDGDSTNADAGSEAAE